jgi:hypothetical protein
LRGYGETSKNLRQSKTNSDAKKSSGKINLQEKSMNEMFKYYSPGIGRTKKEEKG